MMLRFDFEQTDSSPRVWRAGIVVVIRSAVYQAVHQTIRELRDCLVSTDTHRLSLSLSLFPVLLWFHPVSSHLWMLGLLRFVVQCNSSLLSRVICSGWPFSLMVLEISFLVSKLAPVSSSIMSSFRALLSIDDGGWPYICIV